MKYEQFITSAQEHGQDAFHDKARGRGGSAALHLGVMLEHLAKAYLVDQHPAYIIEGKAFDNLLATCGHTKHIKPGHRVRTITLTEALARFGQMNPPFQITSELRLVIEARDGSAHIGERPEDLDRILNIALKAAQQLLHALSHDESTFWGTYADTVTTILTQHTDVVQAEVKLRIAEANRSYTDRFGSMDALVATAIINAIAAVDPDNSTQVECPGCENMGLLSGHSDLDWEPQHEYDKDSGRDIFTGMYGHLILYPAKFRCPFCLLLLEEEDELGVVGLAGAIELRDANDEECRDYHAPDWQ